MKIIKKLFIPFVLSLAVLFFVVSVASAGDPKTSVDLYRSGNASSARMDNVRDKDVTIFKKGDVDWVKAGTGGISNHATLKNEKNEWKLAKGSPYSANLIVKKDTDNHYLWEPAKDMKLSDYITLLQEVNTKYTKLK